MLLSEISIFKNDILPEKVAVAALVRFLTKFVKHLLDISHLPPHELDVRFDKGRYFNSDFSESAMHFNLLVYFPHDGNIFDADMRPTQKDLYTAQFQDEKHFVRGEWNIFVKHSSLSSEFRIDPKFRAGKDKMINGLPLGFDFKVLQAELEKSLGSLGCKFSWV